MIPKNVFVSFRVQVLVLYSGTMALFIFDGLLFSWKSQAFPEAFLGKTGRASCCCLLFLRGDPEKSERKYEYSNISDKKYPSLSSLPLIPPFWNAMIYLPYFVFCSLKRTLSIAYRRRNMMWLWGALTEDKYGRTLQQHWILFSSRNLE